MRHTHLLLLMLCASCAHANGTTPVAAEPPSSDGEAVTTEAAQPPTPDAHDHPHGHKHGHGYAKDFSAVKAYAARFDSPERDAWQKPDEVVRLLELRAGEVVADVGAGTGYFLPSLSRAVGPEGRVLALDVEPNMVRYMRERSASEGLTQVEARQVAPDDPGLPDASVDRVLIVNTWHHISDRERYARKLHAALREGGFVMIVDFTHDSDQGPPVEYRLAPEQVADELTAGGLEAQVVEETLPKQYVVVGRLPAAH